MAEDKRLEQPLTAAEIEELWRISTRGYRDEYGDAAVFAVLPRLLAMLTQAQIEAGVLSRVIDVLNYSGDIQLIPERLAAMLTPPADAAVREAVGHLTAQVQTSKGRWHEGVIVSAAHLDTLLSHIRAAQAPRQDISALLPDDFTESKDYRDSDVVGRIEWLKGMIVALREREVEAWKQAAQAPRCVERERPKVAEEALAALWEIAPNWSRKLEKYIGGLESDIEALRAAAQAPRLTGERLEAVREACSILDEERTWMQERWHVSNKLRAAFPELGEG